MPSPKRPRRPIPRPAPTPRQHRKLQRELETTQARLDSTVEELESANVALRSSNEELRVTNEELRVTNEELESSQEELRSLNEALNGLNAELGKKVAELALHYGDLQNLFRSTRIATIFLDRELRIARFTPAATTVFRLADGDVGRPLSDFSARFDADGVPQEMKRVLETLEPVERTIRTVDAKRSYLMRMHPYRTPSNVIAGVVVSFIDVTKLKETEVALTAAVKERERAEQALRDADHRKDEFLAVLSHELRNPLAPIRNSLHVLEHAQPGGEASMRARQIMARQVGHLVRLVDDLLDVTRVAHGKLQVERHPVDLRDLAQRTAEDHQGLFAARGVALELALPSESVWVWGDATRLSQVIGNLLQNSTKFTPDGGHVLLSLAVVEQVAEVRVRDTGVGIDPELLSRLFRPFSQADGSLDRRQGGLGLGLALVKGLAEMHGGTVDLSSGGKGAGTECVVRLPLGAPPTSGPMVSPPPPRGAQSRRVLVIEDGVDAAESLRLALEMEGHEVEVAHDGPTGLERARSWSPDLVFCDIGLPQMDGYMVARALRDEAATRKVLLVALTGYGLPDDQRRAAEAGFDAHVTKPATIREIHDLVARAPLRAGGGDA